ncbi:MAG: isopropylmalate/homocitrate/citramalate synthase-like protein [Anaerocolumna sp.]|nr:isopropylmalate/homocitrate/citramalate synthase-like protein [Anaerocolumna sp.]
MIRLIDNTLTGFDGKLPSKEVLEIFCELLFAIGVDAVEISVQAYEKMGELKIKGNYILQVDYLEDIGKYPGFYRYTCHIDRNIEKVIPDIQINDVREIIKLRAFDQCSEVRIIGLDDLMCESYDKIMNEMKRLLSKTKINFYPENTYHCASALAVQWLLNYGSDVTTSFAGIKNNAATEEVLLALRLAVRHKPNRDLTVLPRLTSVFEQFSGCQISNKKPVIGKNIFQVESGIHADGIIKNPANYEAYEPEWVGGKSEIIIGKHSGTKAIKLKLQEMDINMPNEIVVDLILKQVKEVCTANRNSLSEGDFVRIAGEVIADERA